MSEHPTLEHEVVIACSTEDRQKCFDIRFEVFHNEQGFSADIEIDEYDKGDKATHFLLRLIPSLIPVGTIRCVKLAPFTYKLTRLAVLKNYRKQKLGQFLVLALQDWVQQQAQLELINSTDHRNFANNTEVSANTTDTNSSCLTHADDHPDQDTTSRPMSSNNRNTPSAAKIITHSQIPVGGFYARFDYQPEGEPFDEDGEPHQKMVLRLPLQQVLHVK